MSDEVMKSGTRTEKEVRHTYVSKLEIREMPDDTDEKVVSGYVNKFNQESQRMKDWWGDEFVEVISESAFDKTLQTRTQKALWNHNTDLVLGSVAGGSLSLYTDSIGLRCEIRLPNTTWGNDAYESIKRGDVDGMSFGFRCIEDKWSKFEEDGKEIYKRTLLEVELYEVSPCTFPAYPDSQINCRGLEAIKENELRKAKEAYEKRRKTLLLKTYL